MSSPYTIDFKKRDKILENICKDNDMHNVDLRYWHSPQSESDSQLKGLLYLLEYEKYLEWKDKNNFIVNATLEGCKFWNNGNGGYKRKFRRQMREDFRSNLQFWFNLILTLVAVISLVATIYDVRLKKEELNLLMRQQAIQELLPYIQ